MKDFFQKYRTEILKKEDNIQGYEIAIEFEKRSVELYSKLYKNAEIEEERNFYEIMVKEEKKHLEALVNILSYLTETGDWFEKEESKIWNWMNI